MRPPRCTGRICRRCCERRTVYSIDLLGEAGLSVQHKPIAGPDDDARWLDETLSGLGLEQAHLLGVSIGGWTAVNYAARRPNEPRRSRCWTQS